MDKFLPDLASQGILLYDSTSIEPPKTPSRVYAVEATRIALDLGNIKCANSVIMGAFAACLKGFELEDYEDAFVGAIKTTFRKKPHLVDLNILAFRKGKNSVQTVNV